MKPLVLIATLLSCSIASANPLFARQDTSSSSSVSVTSTDSSSTTSSSSSTSTGESTSVSTTASSTGSVSSSSTSTGTSSSAPTSTDTTGGTAQCTEDEAKQAAASGGYTGPISLCGITGGNNTLFVGDTKMITWWNGAFPSPDAKVSVYFNYMDGSTNLGWKDEDLAAFRGYSVVNVTTDLLKGGSSAFYRLSLVISQPSTPVAMVEGPEVTILQHNTTPLPPPPTSFNFLGVAIGVPVAVAVIAAVLAVFCCMTKKHRSVFSGIRLPTRRKGYGVRQSRKQRIGGATDDYDFDASAPIYRDEPGGDYSSSTREERSARAMGVFSAERNLHSTH